MFAGGAFVGLSLLVSIVPLVLIVVVFLFAGRGEPDPDGRRPYASYLCAVSFVTLFIALFSLFGVATSVADVVKSNDVSGITNSNFTPNPSLPDRSVLAYGSSGDDAYWNSAVQAGLIAVAAIALLIAHLRRLDA